MPYDKEAGTFYLIAFLMLFMVHCSPQEEKKVADDHIESEINRRLELIKDRIAFGSTPSITYDFILAGITLDPAFERRFTNYSGDQAGRYLTALSLVDIENNPIDIHKLVLDIIEVQKADGRFGDETLSFVAADIEGPQMALLWGNGRLLAGLLDYYERYPDKKEALQSAEKLGGFVEEVTFDCTRPEIIERFKTMGALGFICFTQITEGMAKLYKHTQNERYLKTAESIYPLLPEFGNQHSHGYLNTVRGVAMLCEITRDPVHLAYVENIFNKILKSPEYLITGGVPEFFGNHSGNEGYRDEGCSEADFLILCYQLWELTGKRKYLELAEYSLVNHMFYNQFNTGDFGAHPIQHDYGFITSNADGRAWWCCNYHGLNALAETQDVIFSQKEDTTTVNLFFNAVLDTEEIRITIDEMDFSSFSYRITVENKEDQEVTLALRKPGWSDKTGILREGQSLDVNEQDGYMHLRILEGHHSYIVEFNPVLKLYDTEKQEYNPLPGEGVFRAAMVYGPYLLGIDNGFSPLYLAEPSENNIMFINPTLMTDPVRASLEEIPEESMVKRAYLKFDYRHESVYETSTVILRPISENTYQVNSNVKFWNLYKYANN